MCRTEDCKLRAIDRKAGVSVSRLDGAQLRLEVVWLRSRSVYSQSFGRNQQLELLLVRTTNLLQIVMDRGESV